MILWARPRANETALQAAKNGAADARATAENALPAATRFVSRMLYTTTYSLSYGMVFPVVFIARSIPANNAVVQGLIDGALAATDWVDELKQGQPEPAALPAPSRSPVSKPKRNTSRDGVVV